MHRDTWVPGSAVYYFCAKHPAPAKMYGVARSVEAGELWGKILFYGFLPAFYVVLAGRAIIYLALPREDVKSTPGAALLALAVALLLSHGVDRAFRF